jgi:excisionase family DNA binding protein
MSSPQIPELANQTAQIIDHLAGIIAQKVANQLGQELKRLYETDPEPERLHRPSNISTQTSTHGSLWSIEKLAADSGIQKGTWYKWIAQRRIPAVRLGRSVRIRDEDYRKLIQKSLRPEINLSPRS